MIKKSIFKDGANKNLTHPNTNNGITLIALVITIIVMLILVAVTITMAVNGGLFDYASAAGQRTDEAIANEQLLAEGKVNINEKNYNSIDEYISSLNKEQITFYIKHQGGVNSYTVDKGTKWEDFILEVDPRDWLPGYEEESMSIFILNGQVNLAEQWQMNSFGCPEGVICALVGEPMFEEPGDAYSGPYVYPTDEIKSGVTYSAIR